MNDFLNRINQYCEAHSTPPSPLLYQLERETHLKTLAPQMLSGPLQGQLLSLLSKIQRPKAILEIGTFTGYAALCLAQGLPEGGTLHTIEANPELEYLIRKYIALAGLQNKIHLHIGDALEVIPQLEGSFDLVFIDAGKQDYALYYDLVIDRVEPGGLIIADNVLWSGKVTSPAEREGDADTRLIHQFNEKVQQDPRVENILLPLRDGLLIARKV
ncbi:MAG: O-methyltransferase [Phaeodactylibacter sp.]|nr:O-methyltransferase [Phaeodactylibacter sp.]MCB9053072.1 O-methyltransferase [Lewinellaceae bacterium]